MSTIIASTADITKIEEHVRRAAKMAVARGGVVAAAAHARLADAIANIDAALAARRAAEDVETTAWAAVVSEDERSRVLVCSVRDDLWSAIGRPRQSRYMNEVFPAGVKMYTAGDPRRQPTYMQLLESRISACAAPQWTDEQRATWTADIAAARKAFEAALEAHRPFELAATLAIAVHRAAVRTALEQLRSFKRDLQSLGMTNAQIFDIIPSAQHATRTPQGEPGGSQPPVPGNGNTSAANTPKAA